MKPLALTKCLAIAGLTLLTIKQTYGQWVGAAPNVYTNAYGTSTRVGIGTSSPVYHLHVNGNSGWKARFSGPDGYIDFGPANSSFAHIYTDRPKFIFNKDLWSTEGGFSSYEMANLYLKTNGTTRLSILRSNGFVGIGTTGPSAMLHVITDNSTGLKIEQTHTSDWSYGVLIKVNRDLTKALAIMDSRTGLDKFIVYGNGLVNMEQVEVKLLSAANINARDLNLEANNIADYVFEEDYNLLPILKVEDFIKINKHLPDVPSAAQFKENGMNVSEMNNLLLQKIEELTLYIIEQQKQINELKQMLGN